MPTSAPRDPPAAMLAAYTMHDQIPVETFYVDDASTMTQEVRYSRTELDSCVLSAGQQLRSPRPRARAPGGVARHLVAEFLASEVKARRKLSNVVVFGATDPWVECLCLAAGSKSVTTVEYQSLAYGHPQLRTLSVSAFAAGIASGGRLEASFDLAVALSAFDHDGEALVVAARDPPPTRSLSRGPARAWVRQGSAGTATLCGPTPICWRCAARGAA